MKAVKSSESMLLRQVSRGSPDRRCDFQSEIARPVLVQIGFGQRVLLGSQRTFTAEAARALRASGYAMTEVQTSDAFSTRRSTSAEPLSSM